MIEITIIGNVGSIRFNHTNEISVLNLSIASSRKAGDREFTDWVSAKVWGPRAEKLKDIIDIGQKLMVRGRPQAAAYKRGDGNLAGDLIIHVHELEFVGPRPKKDQSELENVTALAKTKKQRQSSPAKA